MAKKKNVKKEIPSWEWSEYKIKITDFDYSIEPDSDFLYLYGEVLEPKNIKVTQVNILIYPGEDIEKSKAVRGTVHQGKISDESYELGGILWIYEPMFRSFVQILSSERTVYFGISVEKIRITQVMIKSFYFSTLEEFGS